MNLLFKILKVLSWIWIVIFGTIGCIMTFIAGMGAMSLLLTVILNIVPIMYLVWRFKADKDVKVTKLNRKHSKIRKEEEREYKYQEVISNCDGAKKLEKHCASEIERIENSKELAKSICDKHQMSIRANRKDSAILGGLASGIAGTAAGVAVAVKAEAENKVAEERASQDRDRMIKVKNKSMKQFDTSIDNVIEFSRIMSKIKFSQSVTKEELFNCIEILEEEITATDSGANRVKLKLKNNSLYHIDGSIKAIFKNKNNEEVGHAYLPLPILGILDECDVSGICLNTILGEEYSIKYEANNLWNIEQLPSYDGEIFKPMILASERKRYLRLSKKYNNEEYINAIVNKIKSDNNIYFDDLGERQIELEKIDKMLKICIETNELDVQIQSEVRAKISEILELKDYRYLSKLEKYSLIEVYGDERIISNKFIKVKEVKIIMTSDELENLKNTIETMSYKEVMEELEKLRSLEENNKSQVSGGRKYEFLKSKRFNYMKKMVSKYGIINENGLEKLDIETCLLNYLNGKFTDKEEEDYFLDFIKGTVLGKKYFAQLVELRNDIINKKNDEHEIENRISEMMKKFNYTMDKQDNPKIDNNEIIKQLKEFKELLDSGIITQEEFDNKKEELLKG